MIKVKKNKWSSTALAILLKHIVQMVLVNNKVMLRLPNFKNRLADYFALWPWGLRSIINEFQF